MGATTVYVKKTMFMNRENLRRAVRLFNARTEKEAVNRALELAVEDEEILKAHEAVGGADPRFRQVYR